VAGFNGSGSFVRSYNWANDAANSVPITASRMDAEDNGFATGLSNCLTRDGQSSWLANIPAGGFKITGLASGSAANDSCTYGQLLGLVNGTTAFTGRTPFTGTPSGSIPVDTTDLFYGMDINVRATSDTAASTATPGAQIPSLVNVSHYFGGSTVNDGRNALSAHLHQTVTTNASNAYRFYAAANFVADSSVNEAGTNVTPQGWLYGVGGVARLKTGATYWAGCIAGDFEVSVQTGSSANVVAAVVATAWPDHAVHGSQVDAGVSITTASTTPFYNAIQIDDSGSHFPVDTTGTVIKVTGSGTPTVSHGIDMRGISISNYMLVGNGILSTTSTASCTSSTTGALRVSGGAGIAGNLALGGIPLCANKRIVAPTTGATVTIGTEALLLVNPAGTLANLTIVLPTAVADGDTRVITFSQAITTLAWTGTTTGFPTTMARNSRIAAVWDVGTGTWYLA